MKERERHSFREGGGREPEREKHSVSWDGSHQPQQTGSSEDKGGSGESGRSDIVRVMNQLKEHLVQIEALIAYVLICGITLYIVDSATRADQLHIPVWLLPSLFLVGLR